VSDKIKLDFLNMKKELTKNGGLLYQYRPCRRDSTSPMSRIRTNKM
jgi:hypothetical protein